MKKILWVILLVSVFAGTMFGDDEERTKTVTITLTESQIARVERAPQEEDVTIQLTEDQISIIVHNFPTVEISELIISTANLGRENTVELEMGRTGINPVPTP